MSFFKWDQEDTNYGIDIDREPYTINNEQYGDYEVLRRPTASGPGGADLIVPKDIDSGTPSRDDYVEYITDLTNSDAFKQKYRDNASQYYNLEFKKLVSRL